MCSLHRFTIRKLFITADPMVITKAVTVTATATLTATETMAVTVMQHRFITGAERSPDQDGDSLLAP